MTAATQTPDRFTTRRTQPSAAAEVSRASSGTYRYVISTEQVDLQGDIVVQAGLRPIDARLPAQVDHSGHMRDLIGWWTDIETQGTKTSATLNLLQPGRGFNMADLVRELHEESGLRMASSIGFVPDFTDGGYELIRDKSNDTVTGFKFNRSTLIEASVVVVPANPGALSTRSLDFAKSLGMDAGRLKLFVVTDASQRLLQGMPRHDALARAAAAVQKANRILKGGSP
jgi:hypothetical protein